ncbi:MAG TPA: hypothetical protein VG602_00060 [Actinomycetota bacterium]|nr:hypothetical protein [Actinomycetota bacterium]
MRTRLALVSVGLVLTLASSASATHGGIHPTFRSETVYFHCTGPTKVSNLNNINAQGVGMDTPTGWDTNAPTQSVQQGAGCGAIDLGAVRNAGLVDGYFKGKFTGNLRDLTLRVHNLLLSRARNTPTLGVKISALEIDGNLVVDNQAVQVTPVLSSTGASELVELSVTGLGSATEIKDANGNVIDVQTTGLATEDGDGTTPHEITIYLDTDPNQQQSAWVWDTTEVPSGIVFNPPTLAAAQIAATPPA